MPSWIRLVARGGKSARWRQRAAAAAPKKPLRFAIQSAAREDAGANCLARPLARAGRPPRTAPPAPRTGRWPPLCAHRRFFRRRSCSLALSGALWGRFDFMTQDPPCGKFPVLDLFTNCAARSAPWAKMARDCAWCASVSVSSCPANSTWCSPMIVPARTAHTGTSAASNGAYERFGRAAGGVLLSAVNAPP